MDIKFPMTTDGGKRLMFNNVSVSNILSFQMFIAFLEYAGHRFRAALQTLGR